MSLVLDRNFVGTVGAAFSDAAYTISAGSPVFGPSHYGVGARFPAGVQAHITESFTGTTGPRVFSRIVKFSGLPSAQVSFWTARTSGGRHAVAGLRTDGKIQLVSGANGAINASSTNTLPIGTEFRIVFTVNGTAFSAAVYPNLTSTTPTETVSITLPAAQTMVAAREGATDAAPTGCDITIAWPQDDNASDPGLRKYVYATVDKASFIVPELVTVTVADENLPAGTKTYSVDFGDGATAGPQASPTFTHTYTAPGSYNITPSADVT